MSEFNVGVVVSFIVVLVLVIAVFKLSRKGAASCNNEFDERQLLERGNAYKWGFFTALIEISIACVLSIIGFRFTDYVEAGVIEIIGILVPLMVFASYAIVKDAFIGMNQAATGRRAYTIYIIIFVMNLITGVSSIIEGDMIEDGILTVRCANLLCAIFFGVILIACFVKNKMDSQEED